MPAPNLRTLGSTRIVLAVLAAAWAVPAGAPAQEFWGAGSFIYQRTVHVPPSAPPAVVVAEFWTQGTLQPDGRNLAVYDNYRLVPWRVLQVGPGDFCRVAFQAARGGKTYTIFYGGPAPSEKPPPWTHPVGLLLETRRWKACNLRNLESVRQALGAAEPLGSDFVPAVSHRFNPFAPDPAPFLSAYGGTLQIDRPGRYRFFTSSQDCSFLLLDGRLVVAAPGAHGPAWDARVKGEADLAAGPHRFEYLHAAAGPEACMLAAWQPPGAARPEAIPAQAFGGNEVAHLPAGGLRRRFKGNVPDFTPEVTGEVPLADSDRPLVRVRFREVSTGGGRARAHWDFGDGQGTEAAEPVHVYLHPGLYTVRMTTGSGPTGLETACRVQVHRPVLFRGGAKPDQLADYLPMLEKYDPAKLDPPALLQLVRAYEQAGQFSRAARVGKAALLGERPPADEEVVYSLAGLVGRLLRDRLDDPAAALAVWQAAGRALRREAWKAECEVEAADIALNDLLRRAPVKGLLDAATARLALADDPKLASRLHRVRGDWLARGGGRQAACAAYAEAEAARGSRETTAEQNARKGALSRSTEAFLRDGELGRALDELRQWQDQFPADRIEGYQSLLLASWWVARGKLPNAIAVAGDLVAVNPESPYTDQLVFLAAGCEEKLGHADRAKAGYQSLVTDYPGSPLVPAARAKLTGTAPAPKKARK